MKGLISNTMRMVAGVVAVAVTTLLFHVHAADRESLGVPAAALISAVANVGR